MNPRNVNDEYAKQADFERDAYPVDRPKLTLTVFLLRFVLRAGAPFFFSRNVLSSNVLHAVDHDLISSCMNCIDNVLPHLEF